MENVADIIINEVTPRALTRTFVEERLGFGLPIQGATLASIFQGKETILHYRKGNETTATINGMQKGQWHSAHCFGEDTLHNVLFNINVDVQSRVTEYLKKQLAKQGLALLEPFNTLPGETLRQVNKITGDFFSRYLEHVDPDVELLSSLTLRQTENVLNWDIIVRVGIFGKDETVYFQFHLPKIIQNVGILISEDQIGKTTQVLRKLFDSIGEHGSICDVLPGLDIAYITAHHLLHRPETTAEALWAAYRLLAIANVQYFQQQSEEALLEKIKPWIELTIVQQNLITAAVSIANIQLRMFVAFNAATM